MTRLGLARTEVISEVYDQLLVRAGTYTSNDLVPMVAAASIMLQWYDPPDLYSIIKYPRDPTRAEIESADWIVNHLRSIVQRW